MFVDRDRGFNVGWEVPSGISQEELDRSIDQVNRLVREASAKIRKDEYTYEDEDETL